ncbi:hypothetical protein SAMN03159343_3159 [Klenkia marina]|uniref:Uncharacterized protein n=1 Tax=Klenkia marina TaxID=1960309 RepID=A0A1G4YN00_9ACTN|nr:hypothetical protein [Klenkia marina]SCX54857.1 hypothetical protein SAMN03159343_3159 [Klenkia marina]
MLLLIVFGVVVVLALVVLGSLGYALLGAVGRVVRELQALQRDVAPVAAQLQASVTAAAAARQRPSDDPSHG